MVAQECVKAITGKFSPLNQLFYFNAIELLPELPKKEDKDEELKKEEVNKEEVNKENVNKEELKK